MDSTPDSAGGSKWIFGWTGKKLPIAMGLFIGYSAFWLFVGLTLETRVSTLKSFSSEFWTIKLEYDGIELSNYPYNPAIMLDHPRISVEFKGESGEEDRVLSFNSPIIIETNMLMDEFRFIMPDELQVGKISCKGMQNFSIVATDSLLLASSLTSIGIAEIELPNTTFKCVDPTETIDRATSIGSLTFALKRETSSANKELLDIKAHFAREDTENSVLELDLLVDNGHSMPSSKRDFFLNIHRMQVLVKNNTHNYELSLATGEQGFKIINQFEYSGKLTILLRNYQKAFSTLFKELADKASLQQTITLLEKYANSIEDDSMMLILEERDQEIYFGKYTQLQFIQEVFQRISS